MIKNSDKCISSFFTRTWQIRHRGRVDDMTVGYGDGAGLLPGWQRYGTPPPAVWDATSNPAR